MLYPSAPEPPVVTEVHAASCVVTYQPPPWDGGAPVTGYILERRTPGPDSEWIRVNDTPVTHLHYTIDNLTPDTEYEFRVAATNKRWESNFSLMSPKILTVEKPDKPGRPEVMEVIGTSVCLQWTTPHSDGGADVIQYIIMYSTSHSRYGHIHGVVDKLHNQKPTAASHLVHIRCRCCQQSRSRTVV